ncbi:hypothetical protein C8J56DRAFT_1166884 [Mycena floridula]|nr:hypothetical protein C8J56DRAFT_1166884 [Mycena floridula]
MCRVYRIPRVESCVLSILTARWSDVMGRWDAVDIDIDVQLGQHISCGADGLLDDKYFDDIVHEPGLANRNARKFPFPRILAAAFYELSRIDPAADGGRWHSKERRRPEYVRFLSLGKRSARWNFLDAGDRVVLAKFKAVKERSAKLVENPVTVSGDRLRHPRCAIVQRSLSKSIGEESRRNKDILKTLRRHTNGQYLKAHGACPTCTQNMCFSLKNFILSENLEGAPDILVLPPSDLGAIQRISAVGKKSRFAF